MTFELQALFYAAALIMIPIGVQGGLTSFVQGFAWGLGPRDEPRDRSILQGRAARTIANHTEAMALFAPAVIIAHLAGISTPLTVWGAGLFVAARGLYTLTYLAGVPVVRTLLWAGGMLGVILIGWEIVRLGF